MSKFIIEEVFIENFNTTHNQLEKFESGLNIVCGDNEVGKSTIMSFIKSVFLRETIDGNGYINCVNDEEKLNFKINDTKENEKYIDKITSRNYKTGFIINLDDLMLAGKKDSEELINTIKDSSGNAVNKIQNEYNDFIYKKGLFTLKKDNGATKSYREQFNKLKEIDKQIKDLEAKEEEYNNCCKNLENLEQLQLRKNEEYKYAELLNENISVKEEINNIKINEKLLNMKSEQDELTNFFSILNSKKLKENELTTKIENLKKQYQESEKILNKYVNYNIQQLKELNTNIDISKEAQGIIDEKTELKREKNKIEDNIEIIYEKKKDKQKEIDKLNHELEEFQIDDYKKYQEDKILLETYSKEFSEEREKIQSVIQNDKIDSDNYNIFLFVFIGILALGINLLILTHGIARYTSIPIIIVSISGIFQAIMENQRKKLLKKNVSLKKFNLLETYIKNFLKTYKVEFEKQDILTKANSLLLTMTYRSSGYKNTSDKLFDETSDLNDLNNQLSELEEKKKNIEELQNKNKERETNFLKNYMIDKIEDFSTVFEIIKDMKNILFELEKKEEEIKKLSEDTKIFSDSLNKFITDSDIEIEPVNEFEYEKFQDKIKEIQNLYIENFKNNQLIKNKQEQIDKNNLIIDEKYSHLKDSFNNITKEELEELKQTINRITEEKVLAFKSKEELEEVEGLSELKLKRNAELNSIKKQINDLIIKEIIYEIIKQSKEKFNEIQPNLINAKKYLSQITNNKYDNIDFENNCISGENSPQKDWFELSRGTKEQLYLSLRLGYASNYTKTKDGKDNGLPNMPLLIDDAFVNFDKNRISAILKCLENFSETNQVIYFTCHTKYIEELLKSNKIKHNLIKL